MEKIKNFTELNVWKKSHSLTLEIYKITKSFPDEERFTLVSQIRRAAISVPANIAEGFKRRSAKDKVYFYNISQGSLSEVQYYLILAKDLGYFSSYEEFTSSLEEIGKMLNGLINTLTVSP